MTAKIISKLYRQTPPLVCNILTMVMTLSFLTLNAWASEVRTYKNKTYGFTFEYPSTCKVKEKRGVDWISIGIDDKRKIKGYIFNLNECVKKTRYLFSFNKFRSCAIHIVRQWCEAVGPMGESYCTGTKHETKFRSKNDVPIIQLHFKHVSRDYESQKKTKKLLDPTFIVDISRNPEDQRALVFGLASDPISDKFQYKLARGIVRSIKIENTKDFAY